MYKTDNAVIMAAGKSSRFAPLSQERPKALIEVRGEILIERQLRQLKDAGIDEIIIVTGYMAEQFGYLRDKFGAKLVPNREYQTRNNNSSIYAARHYLKNSYVCSSDNYFAANPFESCVDDAYYAAVFSEGRTNEWCLTEDSNGYIDSVCIGGENAWYMLGHTFWSEDFSKRFVRILEDIYDQPQTADMLWESIYMQHLGELKMKIRKYGPGEIFEFDTLDELRLFDNSYVFDTRSKILKNIASRLGRKEYEIENITAITDSTGSSIGIEFSASKDRFRFIYESDILEKIKDERDN